MKFDNTINDIINESSKELKIPTDIGSKIVESYFKTIRHIIAKEEPGVIKVDRFGKFIFNKLHKKKVDEIIKQKKDNEVI